MSTALPKRVGFAVLAATAALLLVWSWLSRPASGDAPVALRPAPRSTVVEPAVAAPAETVGTTGAVATPPPGDKIAAREGDTAEERARAAFIRNVRTGDLRRQLGEGVPLDILRVFASGNARAGMQALIQMGRDGDINGYYAVARLLVACPGPGDDREVQRRADDRKAANDRMIETARLGGASEDVTRRMRWALDAGNAQYRQIWTEFCPGPNQGDGAALLAEARAAVPVPERQTREEVERLRNATQAELRRAYEEARPAAEAFQEQMADKGLVRSQINLEREKLRSPDESARAAAFRKLLELASSSADAKFVLATCIRTACVPDAGGNAEVRALMIDAARLGHFEALRYLSRPTPFGRRADLDLEVSAAEHYAWNSVYEALQADGCFGMVPFGIWARRNQAPPSEALMAMSPAEAKEAEGRARELLAAELPTIRANTACE